MGIITYKVFDEEEWAREFVNGIIQITPVNQFSEIEDPNRRDENEGNIVDYHKIDKNMDFQTLNIFGKQNYGVFVNLLKQDGYNVDDMVIESYYKTNACVLCLTSFETNISMDELTNVTFESLNKGKYFCYIKNIKKFKSILQNKYPDCVFGCVRYSDIIPNQNPFIKRTKYKNEKEVRVLFPSQNQKTKINIGNIKDFVDLYVADNGKLIKLQTN